MARYTSKHTVFTFEDNVGTSITVGPGQGDLNLGPIAEGNNDVIEARNRGVHDGLVEGDDLVQDVAITIELKNEDITSGVAARIMDFIRKVNFFSGAQSVDPTMWAHKCFVTMNDGVTVSTIELPKFRGTVQMAEAKEGWTLAITGKNYLAPVFS